MPSLSSPRDEELAKARPLPSTINMATQYSHAYTASTNAHMSHDAPLRRRHARLHSLLLSRTVAATSPITMKPADRLHHLL